MFNYFLVFCHKIIKFYDALSTYCYTILKIKKITFVLVKEKKLKSAHLRLDRANYGAIKKNDSLIKYEIKQCSKMKALNVNFIY